MWENSQSNDLTAIFSLPIVYVKGAVKWRLMRNKMI